MMIRRAQLGDTTALAALTCELGYHVSPEELRPRLQSLLGSAGHAVFVGEVDGQVLGWLHVFLRPLLESELAGEIGGLVVSEAARRRGLGRALVEAAEQWTVENGAQRLTVRCNAVREEGNRFYEALGFATSKTQKVWRKKVSGGGFQVSGAVSGDTE